MFTGPFRKWAVVAFIVIAIQVAGCGTKKTGRSILRTTIGPRTVTASLDGPGFISSEGDNAIVTFSGGKLVVEKERVLLDNKEVAKIPAEATDVQVDYTGGALSVMAEGAGVYSTKLGH
jgi:hypothetical protein